MSIFQWLSTVYASLSRHIVRSLLAVLGIVLGIAAVVAMRAIGEGGKQEAVRQIYEQGIDNIVLSSIPPDEQEKTPAADTPEEAKSTYGLTASDVSHIMTFSNMRQSVPFNPLDNVSIYRRGRKSDVQIITTQPPLLKLIHCRMLRGRFIVDRDQYAPTPVCVLGKKAARTLFDYEDPIGKQLDVGLRTLTVVGILESPSQRLLIADIDPENACFVHTELQSSLHRRSQQRCEYEHIYFQIKSIPHVSDTAARIRTYINATHATADVSVNAPYELLTATAKTQRLFTIVLTSIAAISLLVGGIGIMNIMLANIYERTREIGVRRALGARKIDIIFQFLGESVFLTTLGGGLGALGGWGCAKLATWIADQTIYAVVTGSSILLALSVAVGTGLIFGTYPAWKAAQLDPLTALRHE